METIYNFSVKDIDLNDVSLEKYKNKVLLIVNVASYCGLTYQYEALQNLYSQYKDFNFMIVGFPSNDFLWQEPGKNEDIIEFCEENYGVTFPMMSKITVKGSKKHPIYQFLTKKSQNGKLDSSVSWNFQKFLVDEKGFVVKSISPRTQPDDQSIIDWIKS